eukprot:g1359.t1
MNRCAVLFSLVLFQAEFARWLVHESNFTIVASSRAAAPHLPFPNLVASSDGTSMANCSGHVYVFFASMMTLHDDIQRDPRVTLGFFEAGNATAGTDPYCLPSPDYDPEDPNCAKVHMAGKLRLVGDTSTPAGKAMAKSLVYWRHPAAVNWPSNHGWGIYTLDIDTIDVLNFYGGAASVTPEDYYKAAC